MMNNEDGTDTWNNFNKLPFYSHKLDIERVGQTYIGSRTYLRFPVDPSGQQMIPSQIRMTILATVLDSKPTRIRDGKNKTATDGFKVNIFTSMMLGKNTASSTRRLQMKDLKLRMACPTHHLRFDTTRHFTNQNRVHVVASLLNADLVNNTSLWLKLKQININFILKI